MEVRFTTPASRSVFNDTRLQGPKSVWNNFLWLVEIPRGSGQPEPVRQKLIDFGLKLGYESFQDHSGNVVIRKPSSSGRENHPRVCLQAHFDIVAVKDEEVIIDLKKDPLVPRIVPSKEDPKRFVVMASGTSLGADCGIGLAMILSVLEDKTLQHGPIDALFTFDEETTMEGAFGVEEGEIKAKYFINTDFFEEYQLGIGSIGAQEINIEIPAITTKVKGAIVNVLIKGLQGGHSGMNAIDWRANAIKLLGRSIYQSSHNSELKDQIHLLMIDGGEKSNAIPRSAKARFILPLQKTNEFGEQLKLIGDILKQEWRGKEDGIELQFIIDEKEEEYYAYDTKSTLNILTAINIIPVGLLRMHAEFEAVVDLSSNMGRIELEDPNIGQKEEEKEIKESLCRINVFPRSLQESELDWMTIDLETRMHLIGGRISPIKYQRLKAWTPQKDGELLIKAKECMTEVLGGVIPKNFVMNGTTEVGILMDKIPNSQAVSFGARVDNLHSPQEMLYIDTVGPIYQTLLKLLSKL